MNQAIEKKAGTVNTRMNLMSAIAIILVVCGHESCGALTVSNLFPYYSYHLPVFIFISGYFYRSDVQQKPLCYIIRNAKKCLGYFFFWEFVYACLIALLNCFLDGMITIPPQLDLKNIFLRPIFGGSYGLTTANWYLIMLFFLLSFNVLLRIVLQWIRIRNEASITLICLAGGCLGIAMANSGMNTGVFLRVTQVLFFLPFFSLGCWYRAKLESYDNQISNGIYLTAVFAVQGLVQLTAGKFEAVSAWMTGFRLYPLVYYIYGINGIALLLRISKILDPVIGSSPAVLFLGRNTRTVMAHHMPVYFGIRLVLFMLMPYFGILSDFDAAKFSSSIYYHYYPGAVSSLSVIYVMISIMIPLCLLSIGRRIKESFRRN